MLTLESQLSDELLIIWSTQLKDINISAINGYAQRLILRLILVLTGVNKKKLNFLTNKC